jgi:hypothetical protein
MAIPTDVLGDDVKELKGELRDIRSNLDVLKADVHRIDVSLAELRSDVRSAIALGKWAGTLLVAALLTSGVGAVIWGARLDAKVSGMETRSNEKLLEAATRADKLEARIDARFDKLEAAIGKLAEQARPATK